MTAKSQLKILRMVEAKELSPESADKVLKYLERSP